MLRAAGSDVDPEAKLRDGSAMDAWRRMIEAQGGDPSAPLPTARESHVVNATSSGLLTELDALAVGLASWRLGAGRARKEDPVQAGAGIELHAKPGDTVAEGQALMTLHTDEPERFDRALAALEGGVVVSSAGTSYEKRPIVLDRVS
jgi:thymidine phosphorylase